MYILLILLFLIQSLFFYLTSKKIFKILNRYSLLHKSYNRNLIALEKLILTEFNDHQGFIFNKINQQITEYRQLSKAVNDMPQTLLNKLEQALKEEKGQARLLSSNLNTIILELKKIKLLDKQLSKPKTRRKTTSKKA